jgi:hypothetical protein
MKEKAMVRSGWMPLLAMSLAALSGTARAAMQLSPGQELIYTGTAVWKQSVSGGPPETFQGRVRIAALVTRAAPSEGYSVDLMAAVTRDAPKGGQRPRAYADLNTVQYRPDLSRTTPWPRAHARDPLGDLIQVLDVPLAPSAALKPGDSWLDLSDFQPVLLPESFAVMYQVGGGTTVAGRSCLVLTKRLGSHLPPDLQRNPDWKNLPQARRDFGGGNFEELEDYTDRIAIDPATMSVMRQDLHARQRRLFGKQSGVIEFSAAITLAQVRQLPAAELADRVNQAAKLEAVEHQEQPLPPNDAAAMREATSQALAAFRRQFPRSAYLPVADQIETSLDQPNRGSDMQAFMEGLQGRRAPDFRLKGLDGREQTLDAYRGRLILLNFFGNT